MQDHAERREEAGVYDHLPEVVRVGLRKLTEEDGATAFHLLKGDRAATASEPTEEVDLRTLLLSRGTEPA